MPELQDYSNYVAAAYFFTIFTILLFSFFSLKKFSAVKNQFKNSAKNEKQK